MAKRASPIAVTPFTYLFYYVMYESEERDETIEPEEVLDMAYEALGSDDLADSFATRFFGLVHLLESLENAGYVSNVDGSMKLHPAIFETAATARTRPNGHFPEKPFFAKVKELANGKYHDFELGMP